MIRPSSPKSGDGLIRRLELEGDGLQATIDFTEFGRPVEAEVPAAAETRELGDLLTGCSSSN